MGAGAASSRDRPSECAKTGITERTPSIANLPAFTIYFPPRSCFRRPSSRFCRGFRQDRDGWQARECHSRTNVNCHSIPGGRRARNATASSNLIRALGDKVVEDDNTAGIKIARFFRSAGTGILAMALFPPALPAASSSQLQIAAIAAEAHGKVSVACSAPGLALDCDLNAHAHPPMQSVFKLPLAFTALHLVEQGKFSLDQPIRFLPGDRILPHTYSPLQDEYPNGGVDVSLRRLLQLSVSFSDNVAADIVLRAIGGPAVVRRYINACGIDGFRIEDGEAALHRDEKRQYRNWFEPAAAVKFLRMLNDNPPLSREHAALLMEWMRTGVRGAQRMPGRLPAGTVTMHKPGTSSIENGMAAATNDIGLIVLPGGRRLALAVFLTDSTADEATRELVIARIARAVYDAAVREIANRAALEVMRRDHLEAVTVALEVSTGTVVVSTASAPANLDVETPVLPLSLIEGLVGSLVVGPKAAGRRFPDRRHDCYRARCGRTNGRGYAKKGGGDGGRASRFFAVPIRLGPGLAASGRRRLERCAFDWRASRDDDGGRRGALFPRRGQRRDALRRGRGWCLRIAGANAGCHDRGEIDGGDAGDGAARIGATDWACAGRSALEHRRQDGHRRRAQGSDRGAARMVCGADL